MHSILWRGIVLPGHEACRLYSHNSDWHLAGTAVFAYESQPVRLDYLVVCDSHWNTLSARVEGWLREKVIGIELITAPDHQWRLNGKEQPQVAGCIDLDLNFSPSTNLIPIRRLGLAVGQAGEVNAAWLRFPSFELERLPQVYRRIDESTYRYESAGGQFTADLKVDAAGFVVDYPGIWQAEATS